MTAKRGKRETIESLALSLTSGILLGLPFRYPGLWFLHYFALVPWALLVTRDRARRTWLILLAGAYVFAVIVWTLISSPTSVVPYLIAVFFAPWYIPFALLVRRPYLRFGVPLTILVPVAWVTVEWVRIQFWVGSVPLFALGSTQFRHTALIQIADTTGLEGVSFLVAAASGALADVWLNRRRGLSTWRWVWPLPAYAVLVLVTLAYGRRRIDEASFVYGPRIALTQPNLKHYRDTIQWKRVFEEHVEFTRLEVPPDSADLIVWPENAIGQPITDYPVYIRQLQELVREKDAEFIVGGFSWTDQKPFMYSSAYHLSATGGLIGLYHKIYLIPWAERLAFEDWLPRIAPGVQRAHRRFLSRITGITPVGIRGPEVVIFATETENERFRFAVPICFEITSGQFARDAVRGGARFLLNITSEGDLGEPVYTHTWALATFRAVENRVGVVRDSNTGISGFIDPNGRTQTLLRGNKTGALFLEPGTLIDRVALDPNRVGTYYTQHGEWLPHLCAAATGGLFLLTFIPRRRESESSAEGRSSLP